MMTELAGAAEDMGFHSLWVAEHIAMPVSYASRYPFTDDGVAPFDHTVSYTEAMVTLGFLAGVTSRIRLGTSVIPIITRDPLSLAKQAATVDVVSGGRLELGLGSGWLLEEAHLLGRPSDHPRQRLAETIQVMEKAWVGADFEHHGAFYDIPPTGVHPHPVQSPIPIWIGGISDPMIAIAADQGVGVIIPARSDEETIAMVRSAVQRLPRDRDVAVVLLPAGDASDVDRMAALRGVGATLIVVQLPNDRAVALDIMERLAP